MTSRKQALPLSSRALRRVWWSRPVYADGDRRLCDDLANGLNQSGARLNGGEDSASTAWVRTNPTGQRDVEGSSR